MSLTAISNLLVQAQHLTKHTDYVIIGSLSVFGAVPHPPNEMACSTDVDLYPKNDPGRINEIAYFLGEDSAYAQKNGYYADVVSPTLASLPDGWESRLIPIHFPSGVTAWFIDAQDAAISKYARSSPRDREWILSGLLNGILDINIIELRLKTTFNILDAEYALAKANIQEDKAVLAAIGNQTNLDF